MSGSFFMLGIAALNVLAGLAFMKEGKVWLGMSNIFFATGYVAFAMSVR